MYVDDSVFWGKSEESLQRLVSVFNRVCEKGKVRINGTKNKVMRVRENGLVANMRIIIRVEEVKQVRCFNYLWVDINAELDKKEEILQSEGREQYNRGSEESVEE